MVRGGYFFSQLGGGVALEAPRDDSLGGIGLSWPGGDIVSCRMPPFALFLIGLLKPDLLSG
jgi:hypothetical protein